jgi:hypothetical protein
MLVGVEDKCTGLAPTHNVRSSSMMPFDRIHITLMMHHHWMVCSRILGSTFVEAIFFHVVNGVIAVRRITIQVMLHHIGLGGVDGLFGMIDILELCMLSPEMMIVTVRMNKVNQ